MVKDYEDYRKEVEQAVQLTVSDVVSEDPRFLERKAPPLSEEFPEKSKIFFLGEHAYGVAAQVSATTEDALSVILVVSTYHNHSRWPCLNAAVVLPNRQNGKREIQRSCDKSFPHALLSVLPGCREDRGLGSCIISDHIELHGLDFGQSEGEPRSEFEVRG